MQRRVFGLQTVRDETREQIDDKIERTAVTRMLNLRDVLKLVVAGLHAGLLAQQNAIIVLKQAALHVGTGKGYKVHLAVCQQFTRTFYIHLLAEHYRRDYAALFGPLPAVRWRRVPSAATGC